MRAARCPQASWRCVDSFLRDEWRWFAMAELVHGEAIAKLLKDGQQAALQQQLHANALIHLASSMKYSNLAAEGSLLLSAAQRFWRHVALLRTRRRERAAPAGLSGTSGPVRSALY